MNFPLFPDQPTTLCQNRMQVYSVTQETPDVRTLSLINHDFYPYRPGQFALVNIGQSGDIQRAYTLSSTPGQSRFIQLTVRRIEGGEGSQWLTEQVKPGDYLWLSDAQGEFTCESAQPLLLLAAGCGVTPVMSITRDILANHPAQSVQVFYSVRSPQDIIFADEWQQLAARYPQLNLTLLAENDAQPVHIAGRLSQDLLQSRVPDIWARRVMICGPAPYMHLAGDWAKELGVTAADIIKEQFQATPSEVSAGQHLTLTRLTPLQNYRVPVGATLLAAMEQHKLPVAAACRAGVCGSCKTRVISGDYQTTSRMTLTDEEVAQGYVLACSCQLQGDVTLA
ncbi:NADH oxidoreductase [Rahnella woolbedingensis]|uniref:NADH oxidoreductase n=1 Tax=Rahnella woolbedingensis TaxID=1510574 RepID=A0A419NDZ9_9GAMM|nr:NADH oxidoreductase [Rahnella woolbedingensis]RJT46840.1 NADH oxidoreductase [Rahnella woolbedingensis]